MDMNTQDIEVLNECKELIIAFKHHLSIVDINNSFRMNR